MKPHPMHIPRLLKINRIIGEKSFAEIKALANAFARAKRPIGVIVDFLEHELVAKDKELSDMAQLYNKPQADLYVAGLLAERAAFLKLHIYLTEIVELEDWEYYDDDEQ